MIIGSINNEVIKILFNTQKEELSLGDLVKITNNENKGVLAQVFRIENSKKSDSNNIASVKILLTIKRFNRWENWEGNIPSKEYKAEKISDKELLYYISNLKPNTPILLGYLPLYNNVKIVIEADKLENPTVIFGDKLHQRTNISNILAQELVKNDIKTVILDLNGEYSHITNVNRIEAGKNFKLPLDSKGIESVYDKTLINATAETRAIIEEIFMDLQDYIESGQLGFVPFTHFKNVVMEEYQQNKITELVLLKNRLSKLEKQGVFANNKFETESFNLCIEKSNFVIVDLSRISPVWQKNFIEHILDISNDNQEFFVIFEATNDNLDKNLLNKLYIHSKKNGIKPILSASYNLELADKLLSIAENLILCPPDSDTGKFKNFEELLTKLNREEALFYGKITNDIPLIIQTNEASLEFEETQNIENFNSIETDNYITRRKKEIQHIQTEEIQDKNPLDEDTQDFAGYKQIYEEKEDSTEDLNSDELDYSYLEKYEEEMPEKDVEEQSYSNTEDFNYTEEDLEEQNHYNTQTDEETSYEEDPLESVENIYGSDENSEIPLEDLNEEIDSSENEFIYIEEEKETEYNTNLTDIPVYSAPQMENNQEEDIEFKEGETIKHQKYGVGTIKKIINYGNKKLCSIQFENMGRRLLDPTLAVIEKV